MKNFAKLVLLFSISFLVIFLISTVFRFLALRVDWAKNLPVRPETTLTLIIAAAHWALSLSMFASILFSLSYAIRKNYSSLMSVLTLIVLSFGFCFGLSAILDNWKLVPPAHTSGIPLGENGIILTRKDTSIVLINGASEPLGPRVISIPGRPMNFQPAITNAEAALDLPPVPFGDDTPWFLKSLAIDLKLNSDLFKTYYSEGFLSFLIYTGSLIILLCSFGCLIKFSAWPLANLFIGVLVFRGILAFELFMTTPEMKEVVSSFFEKSFIPADYVLPLIFLAAGLLLHLYSILISLSKRRFDDGI